MFSKAGSLPCSHPQRESGTHNFYLDSSWRCKEMVSISQPLKSSSLWAAQGVVLQISREEVWPMEEPQENPPFWTSGLSQTPRPLLQCCVCFGILFKTSVTNQREFKKSWICGKICFTKAELKLQVFNLVMKSADGLLIVY